MREKLKQYFQVMGYGFLPESVYDHLMRVIQDEVNKETARCLTLVIDGIPEEHANRQHNSAEGPPEHDNRG